MFSLHFVSFNVHVLKHEGKCCFVERQRAGPAIGHPPGRCFADQSVQEASAEPYLDLDFCQTLVTAPSRLPIADHERTTRGLVLMAGTAGHE